MIELCLKMRDYCIKLNSYTDGMQLDPYH